MPVIKILARINRALREMVRHREPGLYVKLLFPISFAFLLTFGISRIISLIAPGLYIPWAPGLRVHHYAYGFFVLAASGYLALIFDGPRGRYLISLLHGFGLGLAFDEFGIWLNLNDGDPARWSYDGFMIIIGLILLILSARAGFNMLYSLWPKRKKEGQNRP